MSVDIEKLIQDDLKDKVHKSLREQALRKYYDNPNYCKYCGEIIVVGKTEAPHKTRTKQFCNSSCAASYNNKGKRKNYKEGIDYDAPKFCLNCNKAIQREKKYCSRNCQTEYEQKEWEKKWFAGEVSGNNNSAWVQPSDRVRTYLFREHKNKCAACGWGEINPFTGNIPLEIHHKDGNSHNTTPDNVVLLCPNCHSLTENYRVANKGNGRRKMWVARPVEVEI